MKFPRMIFVFIFTFQPIGAMQQRDTIISIMRQNRATSNAIASGIRIAQSGGRVISERSNHDQSLEIFFDSEKDNQSVLIVKNGICYKIPANTFLEYCEEVDTPILKKITQWWCVLH